MYADDVTVFLTDVNDIRCVLDILRNFSKVSGLKPGGALEKFLIGMVPREVQKGGSRERKFASKCRSWERIFRKI